MPDTPPRETFRSFTLRVPQSLYIELAELARAEGVFINQKANQLIKLGMGREVNLNEAVLKLLRSASEDETCPSQP